MSNPSQDFSAVKGSTEPRLTSAAVLPYGTTNTGLVAMTYTSSANDLVSGGVKHVHGSVTITALGNQTGNLLVNINNVPSARVLGAVSLSSSGAGFATASYTSLQAVGTTSGGVVTLAFQLVATATGAVTGYPVSSLTLPATINFSFAAL